MKNKGTILLPALTLAFVLLTIGILIGRSINPNRAIISYEIHDPQTQESISVAVIDGKININTSDLSALCELPGIGETIAKRIIQFREENGPFVLTSEIMKVDGIGEKTFENISDFITVGG